MPRTTSRSRRLDHDPAALRHGIPGVDDEVHDDLFHLRDIAPHRRQAVVQFDRQLDPLVDDPLEQLNRIEDDIIHVERNDLEVALPGEAQELGDHAAGPARGLLDHVQAPERLSRPARCGG